MLSTNVFSIFRAFSCCLFSSLWYKCFLQVWNRLINAVEWNKKEELVAEQALKHLRQFAGLLALLTTEGRSEVALLVKVQEYCYDNMNFMKVFQKIVVLFYKSRL